MDETVPGRTRSATGEFAETYPRAAFFTAVFEHTPASTKEVADAVGCTRQNADYRLRQLRDDGEVRSKKVGPALVWLPTTDGENA